MPLPRLTFDKKWTDTPWTGAEAPFPTYQQEEAQVRADLQYHPDAILNYLNDGLLAALEGAEAADSLGASDGETAGSLAQVLAHIRALIRQNSEAIGQVATGGVPELLRGTRVSFALGDWTAEEEGWTLVIPADSHKRTSDCFTFTPWHTTAHGPDSTTWAAAATAACYRAEDGAIVLTAPDAYDGSVTFFGV